MRLPELCIQRPVFATVINIMVVLLGVIGYQRLSIREYPRIEEPVVTVETTYKGASAEIIETQISKVLEESLAGIEGIDVLSSISRPELSQITVRFRVTRNPDSAASDVRDRVGRVRGRLPQDIDEPVVAKVEADAQPIIYLAFSSDQHNDLFVSDYADRYVKDRLQNLDGVADVRIFGERRYAMRIWLDRIRLAGYRMTPQDVEAALRRQNVEIPAGRIESTEREFTVQSESGLIDPAGFENIVLGEAKGYLVRVKDVASVELATADERRIARFNGASAVALGVVKQSTANPLDVSAGVRTILPKIEQQLPDGMRVQVAYDSSVFIERSIEAVFTTIAEATALVVAVIFLFLLTVRATVIPIITIPVSLTGAFALMYLFGFTINTLTLLSLVLAIGLVVDDAIVVLENIFRHIENGMKPMDAAVRGSREIAFAVVAMTVTLAVVYLPMAFMSGRTGRLFIEFALTLAAAVLVSGFTALTLSPMMCSRLLRHEAKHSWLYNAIEGLWTGMTHGYRRWLAASLGARPLVALIGLGVAGTAYFAFTSLKSELSPIEDRGTIVSVFIAPEGSTVGYTERYARQIETILRDYPVMEKVFVVAGFPVVSQGISFARMSDWSERGIKQQTLVQQIFPKLLSIPGVLAFAINPPSLGASPRDKPLQFVVQTSGTYADLEKVVSRLMDAAQANPALMGLESDLRLNKPEVRVVLDRDKIADAGVSVETVGRTLETMLGGRQVTRFKREGKEYDVIVQVKDVDRRNPDDMTVIYVKGAGGQMLQLSNLLSLRETVAPRELNHFNQLRAATISATIAPGYALGDAVSFFEQHANQILPGNARYDFNGPSREFKESGTSMYVTFLLALVFIYLVLAAQFESFMDPLIILLAVPLSMTGALVALKLSGGTLNVYSQIGLVTLIGLIAKHGILIVEFANQQQDEGKPVKEAVIEAATLRLRPILMTTGAMVLGALPLALATGAGGESRQQIGWVVVGGMLLGTVMTLFVIPTAYTLLAKKRTPLARPEEPSAAAQ